MGRFVAVFCIVLLYGAGWGHSAPSNQCKDGGVCSVDPDAASTGGTDHPAFVQLYRNTLRRLLQFEAGADVPPPKFIIMERGPQGWGNQLRVKYSCFLLALVTNRVFLVENHPMWTENFLPPFDIADPTCTAPNCTDPGHFPWRVEAPRFDRYCKSQPASGSILTKGDVKQNMITSKFGGIECLRYGMPYHFDDVLFANAHHKDAIQQLFGESRFERFRAILSYLTSRPAPRMVQQGPIFAKQIGFAVDQPNAYRVGIHLRLFHSKVDVAYDPVHDRLMRDIARVWDCLRQLLTDFRAHAKELGRPLAVFLTSDSPEVRRAAVVELAAFGPVATPQNEPTHTRLDSQTELTPTLMEWYTLGECHAVVVTGSTFASTAFARRSLTPGVEEHKRMFASGFGSWGGIFARRCGIIPPPNLRPRSLDIWM